MSCDYNTRNKKQEEKNNASAAIVNLETKLLDGFANLKDEVINLKDETCRKKCKVKEQSRGS